MQGLFLGLVSIGDSLGQAHLFAQSAPDACLLVNAKGQGDCLGVVDIDGLAVPHAQVIHIHCAHRTVGGTFSAPGAGLRINIPGLGVHGGREVAFFSLKSLDLAVSQDLDI
jgi:hypothetical protein